MTNRISTKRTDWRLYEEIIKSKEHILLEEDFKKAEEQEKYERIVEVIKEATGIATYRDKYKKDQVKKEKRKEVHENKKEIKKKEKRNPVSWWDEECHEVTDERRKKHKEWIKKQI